MQDSRQFVVKSDRDDGVVFSAKTVAAEARIRRVSQIAAARALASENDDPLTDERLYVQAA